MGGMNTQTVAWFSAGVSSAVATWMMRDNVDHIIYTHIDDQHSDSLRFVKECEVWIGRPITILQSPLKSVDNAARSMAYINGTRGAACTRLLKIRVRKEWESQNLFFFNLRYVWGMDCSKKEQKRAAQLREAMPDFEHVFPLIENGITKAEAHGILEKAGIKRPAMYDLGYQNNNCIGCLKGGRGYWNRIRVDFPEVFKSRCELERLIDGTCLKKKRANPDEPASEDNTVRLYLDELDPEAGRDEGPIIPECGAMCELLGDENENDE
jgi:hypothetical protein